MIIVLLNAAHNLRDPCTQVKPQEWYDGKKILNQDFFKLQRTSKSVIGPWLDAHSSRLCKNVISS